MRAHEAVAIARLAAGDIDLMDHRIAIEGMVPPQRLVQEGLSAGYRMLVAGGGDGTLRDVAEAMAQAEKMIDNTRADSTKEIPLSGKVCSNCDAVAEPGDAFCSECGNKF